MTVGTPATHRYPSLGLTLNYVDWGNAGAPLLMLVHGGGDHARSWDWVAQALRDRYHIVCPDLRGHGDSDWSPDGAYSAADFVGDLAELADRLGDGTFRLVGHSLGGAVALRYAGIFPERIDRLVAIEGLGLSVLDERPQSKRPKPPVAETWRKWIEERRALAARPPRPYPTIDAACARMRERNGFLSAEQALHLTRHGVRRAADGSYRWKFDRAMRVFFPIRLPDTDLHEFWRNVDCPVWLVHGADSWAHHPGRDGRAAHFGQATVTSYERAGHWVQHDRFESFVADLEAFLR